MAKPITTFAKQVVSHAILVVMIALLIISVLIHAFPAYSQDMSLTELETKALMLNKQGQYSEAVKVAEEALKATEEKFGSDHPKTAASMSILGLLYFSNGKYTDAEPLYLRALKINTDTLGEESLDVATDIDNLALLYQAQGRYSDSITLYKQALQIKEKALDPYDPSIAGNHEQPGSTLLLTRYV